MALIGYELRKIIGRRGSFFGTSAAILVIALIVAFAASSEDQNPDLWLGFLGGVLVLGGSVVGALAGAYDASQNIMRYLVLTGVPRWKLVLVRVPAVALAIILIALPSVIVGAVAMLGNDISTEDIAYALAGALIQGIIWGIVALVIGTLMRSNGPAIAIAIVLYFVGGAITAAVGEFISQDLADLLLPNAAAVFAYLGQPSDDLTALTDMSFGAATAIVVVWIAGLSALAVARVERDEY